MKGFLGVTALLGALSAIIILIIAIFSSETYLVRWLDIMRALDDTEELIVRIGLLIFGIIIAVFSAIAGLLAAAKKS